MKKLTLITLLCAFLKAQQAVQVFDVKSIGMFQGAALWTQSTPNLLYGQNIIFQVPLSKGLYAVTVQSTEPNKTGSGQRVFTITCNGQQSAPLDLFKLTGGQGQAYETSFLLNVENKLTCTLIGSVGNAVVDQISVRPWMPAL